MIKKCISKNWKFKRRHEEYVNVDLPHDYAINSKRNPNEPDGDENGYYPRVFGTYVKYFQADKNKHYILNVDGAYMCSSVSLNENVLANHPYGFSPYLVDLTEALRDSGTNKLVITTDPISGSVRWYSGSGLYRDVFLWEGGDIRIEPWDMFISTEKIEDGNATIRLKFIVSSDRASDIDISFTVLSDEKSVKTEKISASVKADEKTELIHYMDIENPNLWDIENPHLYTLKTEIFENNTLTDTSLNNFGVRTITADVKNGLLLNGKPVKLRGGCIHHDHGVLGAAAFPAAEERKIRKLQAAGFNAIRTAHNPPSLALLEVCDRLGMIVMDEAFDEWNKKKKKYYMWFEDWCKRDIQSMVMRDRNHPCVFSYSIGNEILEIDGTSRAAELSKMLADEIRKYDDTKFVTSGINKGFSRVRPESIDPPDYAEYLNKKYENKDFRETAILTNNITAGYEAPLDIIGTNYYYESYLIEHEMYPERVIWGSETHALHFYDSWELTKNNNFILGDFTWTAYDNMGEVGTGRFLWERDGKINGISTAEYPWRCCYQGDLDLCGYRRPQSYFREAVWLGNKELKIFTTHPEHFNEGFTGTEWHWYDIAETWTFEDKYIDRPIKVETYTCADIVKWYVNGEYAGESIPEKGIAYLETVYKKGCITAEAYKDDKVCSKGELYTTKAAQGIDITPCCDTFKADNRDLCYFEISVTDIDGRLVTEAENELKCHCSGGELLGIYSGNPCNEDQYTSDTCHAFYGRALAVVRACNKGEVSIKVYSENLASGYARAIAE